MRQRVSRILFKIKVDMKVRNSPLSRPCNVLNQLSCTSDFSLKNGPVSDRDENIRGGFELHIKLYA